MRTVACVIALALSVVGCAPTIVKITAFSSAGNSQRDWAEDQPKIIQAEVSPTPSMIYQVRLDSLTAVAPTQGQFAGLDMPQSGTAAGHELFAASLPNSQTDPPMAYGTLWDATVSVPYTLLWQRAYVTQTERFRVGGAQGCFTFDGPREKEGWTMSSLMSSPGNRPPIPLTLVWVGTENARPAAEGGALSVVIPDAPGPEAGVVLSTRFQSGGLPWGWGDARGMRVTVKSDRPLFDMYAALLVFSGNSGGPGTTVQEWVYTNHTSAAAGSWQVVELMFPPFPPPVGNTPRSYMNSFTVNISNLASGMNIMIDDVCPIH